MQATAISTPVSDFEVPSEFERLHPNVRITSMLGTAICVAALTSVGAVIEVIFTRGSTQWPWPTSLPLISLISGAVLLLLGIISAYLQFARFGFQLRDKDLIVQSGVIWRSRRCVPRARIQHVDIDSGPIDRALGLVQVRLYVAGGLGAVAELRGVSPQAAEQLKEALIVAPTDGV